MLDKLVKLEKLTITALDPNGNKPNGGKFKCLFNPSKYSLDYAINYQEKRDASGNDTELEFSSITSPSLSLELILDGTGVDQMGLAKIFGNQSVKQQIKDFFNLAYKINGKTHESNAVQIKWGDGLLFEGRLKSAKVNYELFDKNGEPLRVKINATFFEHKPRGYALKEWNLSSPDLTHIKLVNSDENILLKTYEIYQDCRYYLEVARVNKLNNFRRLQVGQKLIFPPIEQ